jgi:hypothetical protein
VWERETEGGGRKNKEERKIGGRLRDQSGREKERERERKRD